ncbi:ABC transporter ATP-binding protein [Paenibacillus doosanensis]|uniref:ABC transporter ATP-binding protein n=1 Tax=Paenibacillus doosanensis TaxID=1229154 RepID=UPI00217FB94C|nr:ABC transporter ATP-binding protein [Paenibacillus doosanensis]MCS7462687.1 ABC transporter ATP-binding protein [Paenibacillus doosanensis]
MNQLLDIQHLSVDFRTPKGVLTAITDVTLHMQPGETVCLVGESGSGKTITSKSVMRLVDFENGSIGGGSILLDGVDLTALPERELRALRGKKMAMVFQEPMAAFDPVFTIGSQIVESILEHEQVGKAEAWRRAVYLLGRVGIPEPELRMKQYPNELSGGMLQRAMIAMALACGPELLIADEPTTALDVTIQAQILHLLQELKQEFRMSILLITHDMGIAAEMADRIIVMYAGTVVEQATVYQLFEQPHHPYTRGLLQSITTMDSDRSGKLFSIEGSIPNLAEMPTGCRFHPRCPYATDRCAKDSPPLFHVNGRQSACWYAEELVRSEAWQASGAAAGAAGSAREDGTAAGRSLQETAWLDGAPETAASSRSGAVPDPDAEKINLIFTNRSKLAPPLSAAEAFTSDGAAKERGNLFEVQGLHKYYPLKKSLLSRPAAYIRAVDDVSFTIRKGETFGLVGESGSGKSTLGRLLLQLEKATQGSVLFQGTDLSALRAAGLQEARRNMQMIFQDPYGSVNPRWKVGDIITEPFRVHEASLSGAEKRRRAEELLQAVGLNPAWHDRYPHEFSGGQRQRIGIARAIALRPQFILADEAVSALDVSVQAQIVNLMQDLQRRLDLTYLFIAHGLNIVRHISDRIGVMYLGKLVEIGPSEELFRHPAHHYTRGLISSIPAADPTRKREWISIQGEIPSPASPPAGCRFHTRCPAATAGCREAQPELTQVAPDHWAACHYPV